MVARIPQTEDFSFFQDAILSFCRSEYLNFATFSKDLLTIIKLIFFLHSDAEIAPVIRKA
jgi:hypothetical protein